MAHVYRDMPAAGSVLSIEIGYVMVPILGATEISVDGFKRSVRSPTHLMSEAVVKKPGMPDFGQIKCKVFFDPNDATHQAIRDKLTESAAVASAALDNFELTYADGFPTSAKVEFTGFVSEFSHAAGEVETGTWTADMTIEIVTSIFTAGSPAE